MADAYARVGPLALTNAPVTIYTVPVATVLTLRSVHISNEGATPEQFTLSIGADVAGARLYRAVEIPGNGAFDWSGFMPIFAGEILEAFASVSGQLTITIGGVETT
jgi:hypothetical protein